jgi:hypothetical protein
MCGCSSDRFTGRQNGIIQLAYQYCALLGKVLEHFSCRYQSSDYDLLNTLKQKHDVLAQPRDLPEVLEAS